MFNKKYFLIAVSMTIFGKDLHAINLHPASSPTRCFIRETAADNGLQLSCHQPTQMSSSVFMIHCNENEGQKLYLKSHSFTGRYNESTRDRIVRYQFDNGITHTVESKQFHTWSPAWRNCDLIVTKSSKIITDFLRELQDARHQVVYSINGVENIINFSDSNIKDAITKFNNECLIE